MALSLPFPSLMLKLPIDYDLSRGTRNVRFTLSSVLSRVKRRFYLPFPSVCLSVFFWGGGGLTLQDQTRFSLPFRWETLGTRLKALLSKPLGSKILSSPTNVISDGWVTWERISQKLISWRHVLRDSYCVMGVLGLYNSFGGRLKSF